MNPRELVVVSGKGGTGKTSLVGSFAVLASDAVIADCDVDAADLHLLLSPEVRQRVTFRGGRVAVIDPARCDGCGDLPAPLPLRRDLFRGSRLPGRTRRVRGMRRVRGSLPRGGHRLSRADIGGVVRVLHAVRPDGPRPPRHRGRELRKARLDGPREARRIAEAEHRSTIIVDGPPGIGCPVIASVTGATGVLAVTEPTVSGEHDLERLLRLCRHFAVPVSVCVNRWDVNPEAGMRIEAMALGRGARLAGRIPYDRAVTAAQMAAKTVVEVGGPAADAIRGVWRCWTGSWPWITCSPVRKDESRSGSRGSNDSCNRSTSTPDGWRTLAEWYAST